MRRYGERPQPGRRYEPRPGAYGVVRRGNAMLMTIEDSPSEVEFQIPGGGIDPGESPLQALHREVLEETGWRIGVERRIGSYQRFCYMPDYDKWAHKICHIYLCHPVACLSEPTEPHHTAFWAPIEDGIEMITNPADGDFIARALPLIERRRNGRLNR